MCRVGNRREPHATAQHRGTAVLRRHVPLITAISAIALIAPLAHAAGDAQQGKALYASRCAACHSVQFNGAGPAHKGVFGRRAGTAAGFAFSPALKAATVVWSEESLDKWLADPEKFLPGQRMGVNITDANERANLVAYLATLTAK